MPTSQPASQPASQPTSHDALARDHWFQPTAIRLPYLDASVPLLLSAKGHHMVPVAALCRILGLPATLSIQRVRHRFLWSDAQLLPLPTDSWPQRGAMSKASPPRTSVFVWCLPYPLDIGYWLSFHSGYITNPLRRGQIKSFVDDILNLSAFVHETVHLKYQRGRQGMFALNRDLTHLMDLSHRVSERAQALREAYEQQTPPTTEASETFESQQALVQQFMRYVSRFLDRAQQFVQEWSNLQSNQIIVDTYQVSSDNRVIGESSQFAPFGSFSQERQTDLDQLQQHCTLLLNQGEALLHDLSASDA